MDNQEFGLFIHRQNFLIKCHESPGMAFQHFFETIMECNDRNFIPVRPNGRDGDWKCDGYNLETGTFYAVYAPKELTAYKSAKKIKSDFEGALERWSSSLKHWNFVYANERELPPQAVEVLMKIKKSNSGIKIEAWNRERLWDIVAILPESIRVRILGPIPTVDKAKNVTMVEVQTLLNFLVDNIKPYKTDSLLQIDLKEKLENNHLGEHTTGLVKMSLPIARIVSDYAGRHPDTEFSSKVVNVLINDYVQMRDSGNFEPDNIYYRLITSILQPEHSDKEFWAATGIITFYFQLCDLFES